MDRFEELEQENVVLREHLSRLSQASLRINESLELDSVLQGVLDSAKLLTEARLAVLTLLDGQGHIQDVLSSGMTTPEALGVWNTPDGIRILEFLDGLTGPIRIPDVLGRFMSNFLESSPYAVLTAGRATWTNSHWWRY